MNQVIVTQNLFKAYTMGTLNVEILKDINISINKGEFVSIMGPSGSGKSTLLYLLGGLDRPTSGSIKINDKELSSMSDKAESAMRRRDLGFVFQFYNLVPNLSVEENVLLPILLDGKKAKKYHERLNELLELIGLADRKNHTPRELSGGQQQRVAIARALINDPEIILADEPIGNLDSKTGIEVMKLLKRINLEKSKTIIQVTHSSESAEYGNRTINLLDGRVCQQSNEE
ncbi:lipoprotein-releasing system ATP-binding protein LolD [Desulfosporosinus acididurans]|uniref:Lipoprotein-releasing system ATP-binding protein LolD n=1 Tax=Desulfosporosinus acididurans TaxID=476652 RepID=A0A0J1FST2_9FIRM|nr:ABC transporter ATP-binding protein [Desulfosporosinus acididurans]KLU66372.1 lipoprotein-releasing system ATP-binding protein LolD [Desulfosporosinus acididurans]